MSFFGTLAQSKSAASSCGVTGLAFACGLQATPRPVTPQELAADFDWAKVPKNDIVLPENMF